MKGVFARNIHIIYLLITIQRFIFLLFLEQIDGCKYKDEAELIIRAFSVDQYMIWINTMFINTSVNKGLVILLIHSEFRSTFNSI